MLADVVVIGAGASGLACGRRLSDAGLDVIILDARERIGGRIHTFYPADGSPGLELGAQVIHGDRNPLHALGLELRLVPRAAQARVIIGGQLSPFGALAATGRPPWVIEGMLAASGGGEMTVAQWLDIAWPGRGEPAARLGRLAAAEWFRQNWAADPADLSAGGVAGSLRADAALGAGSEFLPADGYAAVPARLAAGLTIKLGCAVSEIGWVPGSAMVTAGEVSLRARAVVVTAPPHVLTAGQLTLPGLPARKRAAAEVLRPGDGCCAVLTMSRPAPQSVVVFDADGAGGFIRCDEGRPEVLVVAKAAAAASVREALRSGELPALAERALPWTRGASALVSAVCDWGSDRWAGGSFTFPVAGASWAPAAWAEPVADTIFFAGEATCDRPARVHGAMESGERAAAEVLEVVPR
jgi:monoamine oxidase